MDRMLNITLKEYLDQQHAEVMREIRVTQAKQDTTNGRVLTAEKDIIRLQERADVAAKRGAQGLAAGAGTALAAAALWLWERLHV